MPEMGIPLIHQDQASSITPAESGDLASLINQRSEIEVRLDGCAAVLDSQRIGMAEPLIDSQGFPRSDIDVAAVRIARASIIRLRNDYKQITDLIEKRVHAGFQSKQQSTAPPALRTSAVQVTTTTTDRRPFARIASIADASPAALAGLRVDDRIVTFGQTHAGNHGSLSRLGQEVAQAAENNSSIEVTLLRQEQGGREAFVRRVLRPNTGWGGRGAVGAHFLPLE
jgi:26S proteasome non-ATPase regulatory subunit 9